MDIPTQEELLAKVEAFCIRHEMAETRFGRDSVNNPNFIRGLREGKSPTLDTLNKVQEFMAGVETAAKLRELPPLELAAEEEVSLPFGTAPVKGTGASSPISSPTSARLLPREASGSCPSSSSAAEVDQ
jgi:hypothetical protein